MLVRARMVVPAVTVTLLLLIVGFLSAGTLQAQSRSRGNTLVGLWHFDVPLPGGVSITGFMNAHQGGTLSMVRTVDEGTALIPPPPPAGRQTSSHTLGIWQQRGNGFEGVSFIMTYDYFTGDPTGLTRLRFGVSLDRPRFNSATGVYSFAVFPCPGGFCPDPTDPNVPQPPEIGLGPDGEPSLPWTLSRIRMQ